MKLFSRFPSLKPAIFRKTFSSFALIITAGCSQFQTITPTPNPLVASYALTAREPGTIVVEFGKDKTYGFSTSPQTVTNGPVSILVAGMQASTTYHMRSVLTTVSGDKIYDSDHVFTTGVIPAKTIPAITAGPIAGNTPQPGVELVDPILNFNKPFIADLNGNVIWYYSFPDAQPASLLYPIRLLSNGHMACLIAPASQSVATNPATPVPAGSLVTLREFDLAGTTVRELTMAQLNQRMAAAGFNVTLQLFSHDFQQLSNGHWLIIANTVKSFSNLTGLPGNTDVTGDVVVDLDANWNPAWYWNEFDHFDVNRHPYMFPDWTHTNAITYSPDDGNFIVSIRHQNWVVKVDYRDGAGTGNVIWKLGEGGDFKLVGGVDPTDWFYAQHNSVFVSPNSTGIFNLALMDNGDDRAFPANIQCGSSGAPPCLYTTVPILQVNETARTASFRFHQTLPTSLYNSFAGDTEVLDNTNVEYALNAPTVAAASSVHEVTQTANPESIWQMEMSNTYIYRAYRMPSLYPGVQW